MKGDTTPMKVLLVVDSSTGYLGGTDVDQRVAVLALLQKWMAKWLESTGYARMKAHSDAEQSIEQAVKSISTADLIVHRSRVINLKVMSKEQYDWLRISTEPCFSTCRKGQGSRLTRFLQHRHGDTETFSLASQQISATQRRSDIIRTSHKKSIHISDSSVVRDGGVFDSTRSKTWRSSRGCERNTTNISINVGWSDEHLVVNEIGHVVRARTVRRCVENENSGSDVIKLNATPSYFKPDGDDVGRQDAERASRHMQTNTWSDVKHVDTSIV